MSKKENDVLSRRDFLRFATMAGGSAALTGSGYAGHKRLKSDGLHKIITPRLNPAFRMHQVADRQVELFTHTPNGKKIRHLFDGLEADLFREIAHGKNTDIPIGRLSKRCNLTESECKEKTQKYLWEYAAAGLIYYGEKMKVKSVEMCKTFSITSDLFTIPYKKDKVILYAPRRRLTCVVNHDLLNLLADIDSLESSSLNSRQIAALRYLEKKRILNGPEEYSCVKSTSEVYSPTHVTLFPSNQCNLRCIYCYASAGDSKPEIMDWNRATSAIDIVINNSKKRNSKRFSLGFHGGGEPLLPWRFVKRIVSYAKDRAEKEGLNLAVFAATNGLLKETQLEWIVKHFANLNISFDGLPHVQNYHRPLPNGKDSFEFVDRTMRFLDDHNFNYGIRSTISSFNADLMAESIDYIGQNYKTKSVHFEPLFHCGRCKKGSTLSPDLKLFSANYQKSEKLSEPYGIALTYSGCKFERLSNSFCGVTRDNFALTPDGYVTTCYEVTSKDDPASKTFFIGKMGQSGKLSIDEGRRQYLQSLTVDKLEYCRDCFAKWHCAGDCLVKISKGDYSGDRGHERCEMNRQLIRNRLINLVEGTYHYPSMKNYGSGRAQSDTAKEKDEKQSLA